MLRNLQIVKKDGDMYLTWIDDEIYPVSTLSKMLGLSSNSTATFMDRRFRRERTIIIALSQVSEFIIGEPVDTTKGV